MHTVWFDDTVHESIPVWRYLAFYNGVIRVTPGTSLVKAYNPVARDWWVNSLPYVVL